MIYVLKVECDDEDKSVEIGAANNETAVITDVVVWLDTIDDDTNSKSKQMLARVDIQGQILGRAQNAPELKDKLRKIFLWAMDFDIDTTYRKVTLVVKEDETHILRTYEFDKMFIRDYKENYISSGEKGKSGDKPGTFKIELTQQENQLDTIEVL